MSRSLPHITVCICTYQRPKLLQRLLDDLARQDTGGLFSYSIVVAENDRAQAARSVVSDFAARSRVPVTYCAQFQRNIALTRNLAVENARGEFVAFVDDDELPTERWLQTLFCACRHYEADGVLGPVVPHFDSGAPGWIVKGGLFDRPMHETGRRLSWPETRTGNVLLKRRLFTTEGLRFDPQFLSGSDQQFFRNAMEGGSAFVWCNEAVVYEAVPPARWRRSFLIRRAVFRGVFAYRKQPTALGPIAWSLFAVPAYLAVLPITFVLGQAKFMRYVFSLSYHVGRLLAVLRINPVKGEYVSE